MSAWVLDAPGRKGSSRRLAWLENEYARLSFECQYLQSLNVSLSRRVAGFEEEEEAEEAEEKRQGFYDDDYDDDDFDAAKDDITSPEQITLDTEPDEPPVRSPNAMGTLGGRKQRRKKRGAERSSRVSYRSDASDPDPDLTRSESTMSLMDKARGSMNWMGTYMNAAVMKGSALGKSRQAQAAIYLIAFGGVIFVLLATATHLGVHDEAHAHGTDHAEGVDHGSDHGDAEHGASAGLHRRLGGAAPLLLKNIAFSLVGAGLVSFLANFLRQPLIIGYLLGGILVGPIGLGIVTGHTEIDEIAELGLLFLLFMIGMELDFHQLWKMDRVVLVTGFFQFPICAAVVWLILSFLVAVTGLRLGSGEYPVSYISLTCAVSSTRIVVKMMTEKFEVDSPAGRLTHGILICQDIWCIVVLAVQPTFDRPDAGQIIRNFAVIGALILVALAYAKFVMPPVLLSASKSVELMLVLSLSWCFFLCSAAVLPFVGLSMEVAALIAGTALATFPYSHDFNSKIKFIRDFFITLFFAGVGMQVPVPRFGTVATALLVAIVVLAVRWLGIFALVLLLGGEARQGTVSTINLSQISEFAIVICSMGLAEGGGFGHIGSETMTIVIWAFAILAVVNCYAVSHSSKLVRCLVSCSRRLHCRKLCMRCIVEDHDMGDEDDEVFYEDHKDVVFLGFHRIAAMLIAEFQVRHPEILSRIHVIDINPATMSSLREKGIKCSWGDFASAKDLSSCQKGEAAIVISSIPDSLLQGVTNKKLLRVSRQVWPNSHFIATADSPYQAQTLYDAGADYVVRMAKLCAERLHELLANHCTKGFGSDELTELFDRYKSKDKDTKGSHGLFLSLKV